MTHLKRLRPIFRYLPFEGARSARSGGVENYPSAPKHHATRSNASTLTASDNIYMLPVDIINNILGHYTSILMAHIMEKISTLLVMYVNSTE